MAGHAGDAEMCEAVVTEVMRQTGRLDVLVNNAATNPQFGPILDADEGAINKIWDVNVLGPLRLTRHAVAAWMRDHGGSVINMSSVAGIRPEPLTGAYNASKAALITLTRTLARELGPLGIRVNAIAPGLVETEAGALPRGDHRGPRAHHRPDRARSPRSSRRDRRRGAVPRVGRGILRHRLGARCGWGLVRVAQNVPPVRMGESR